MREKRKKGIFRRGMIILIAGVFPLATHAQIVITEVMYDLPGTDAGREWIEIKNDGESVVDLSMYRLSEAETNHKINAVGGALVAPNSFAVIADDSNRFMTDNPDWTGTIFDSVFSLSNTGETLILRDQDLSDVDFISYSQSMGAVGDGNSLQKTSSGWTFALPTPGKEYAISQTSPSGTSSPAISASATSTLTQNATGDVADIPANYSSHSSQAVASVSYDSPELEVSAGRPRLGFVGVPLSFEAKTKSAENIPLGNAVSSFWSMGDGTQISGQFVSHMYEFPGEYIVILNSESGGTNAVSRVKVKIVEPKVAISFANAEYIQISNDDIHELNLGGWILETGSGRFVIPRDTIISPHSFVKLPASITKLANPTDFLRIANPKGAILAVKNVGTISGESAQNIAGNPIILLPEGIGEKELMERLKRAIKK